MQDRCPFDGVTRRKFLGASAATVPLISAVTPWALGQATQVTRSVAHQGGDGTTLSKFAAPGLYPGQVVEVRNPLMCRNGNRDAAAIKTTLDRGMKELTGATDALEAWRHFFEPGDVVGIKVVPNGQPQAHSSFEIVLEVIEKLRAAGVKAGDIFVYDRYREEFMTAGYHKILPDGIHWGGLDPDGNQFVLDFPSFRNDPIAGFDHDAFVWMDLIPYGDDPKDERKYRSHLGKLVTKTVNKIVAIPVLKDHGSAGVTGALKNMSHGTVNNVARSHSNSFTNVCNQFIPQMVTHPIIRQKFVLQIMDGIRGVYQGGPFSRENGKWTWEHNAILFATDPVALDHVEWDIVDAQRVKQNLPPVAASGKTAIDPLKSEGFDIRQPQHIALAGALGMGYFDFKSNKGRRFSIGHRVVTT
ncbi:MAG TPA: DUF362 domain-containing protein [Isosphaeraceae bacterium]|nr:DUF362 domain-containing protein [Isosphaeraceae bacterium]